MNTEFYQAQVEIVYTDPIKEVTLYQKYDILNNLWQEKFDCRLFKNESKDIIEILNLCTKYKKIVLSSFDDFRSFITDWNILILEGLDANNLKISAGNAQVEVKNDH